MENEIIKKKVSPSKLHATTRKAEHFLFFFFFFRHKGKRKKRWAFFYGTQTTMKTPKASKQKPMKREEKSCIIVRENGKSPRNGSPYITRKRAKSLNEAPKRNKIFATSDSKQSPCRFFCSAPEKIGKSQGKTESDSSRKKVSRFSLSLSLSLSLSCLSRTELVSERVKWAS